MKRLLDLVCTIVLMILVFLLAILTALLVYFQLGSPILFKQQRPGLKGKPFYLFKFRSMRDIYDSAGQLLPDGERLTSFGKFLRTTSLDELPQLWNVLKGDMSIVGPRPLLMEYLPLYTPEQARRHDVKPGITGWAQVNGRNAISWSDKFDLDVWYVDHQSLWLDIKILYLTMVKVIKRNDINQSGRVTIEKFRGMAS